MSSTPPVGRFGSLFVLFLSSAFLLFLLGCWLFWQGGRDSLFSHSTREGPSPSAMEVIERPVDPLPGEMILRDYADPSTRPEDDLHAVSHALGNLALLIKGPDPFRIGANEELANALRGKNRAQMRFLPDDHRAFNAKGQIVDRWQTPLYFHAKAADRLEVRSAGPDRKMWTADDLHRSSDGSFLTGDDLNARSLNDIPGPGAPRER